MLTLQRQVGNAQIARMLAQRAEAPEKEDEDEQAIQAKHDPSLAQRAEAPEKEDEDEQAIQAKHDPSLAQRAAAEEEENPLQASPEVGLEGGPVSAGLAAKIDSQRGGGAPLDTGLRSEMEGALGANFDGVRVHTGAESQQLNRSISAKAFTTGSDIFLGQGASAGDHSLMAHELTHVVQQQSMTGGGPMTVGPAGDSYEQQADATAASITAGTMSQRQDEDSQ
jgi:hypothetical protein